MPSLGDFDNGQGVAASSSSGKTKISPRIGFDDAGLVHPHSIWLGPKRVNSRAFSRTVILVNNVHFAFHFVPMPRSLGMGESGLLSVPDRGGVPSRGRSVDRSPGAARPVDRSVAGAIIMTIVI